MEFLDDCSDDHVLAVKKTWNDQTVYIVVNLHEENTANVNMESYSGLKLADSVSATEGKTELKNQVLVLPAYTIAILTGGN